MVPTKKHKFTIKLGLLPLEGYSCLVFSGSRRLVFKLVWGQKFWCAPTCDLCLYSEGNFAIIWTDFVINFLLKQGENFVFLVCLNILIFIS